MHCNVLGDCSFRQDVEAGFAVTKTVAYANVIHDNVARICKSPKEVELSGLGVGPQF